MLGDSSKNPKQQKEIIYKQIKIQNIDKQITNKQIINKQEGKYNFLHKIEILSIFRGRDRVYNFKNINEVDKTFRFLKESIVYENVPSNEIQRYFTFKINTIKKRIKDKDLVEYIITKYTEFNKFCMNH